MNEARFVLNSPADTERLAHTLGRLLEPYRLLALKGEMGAGKTFFTHALAAGMGITDPVSSPTFALVNEYRGPLPLVHIDAYRLTDEEAMETIGFTDYLKRPAVMAVEWAERLEGLLPEARLDLYLEAPDPLSEQRYMTVRAYGALHLALLQKLVLQPEPAALQSHAGPHNE